MKATARIPVPRIPAWVGFIAIACAVLLSGAANALPGRWQELALYAGVGLAFASVGGIVFSVLLSARPEWQGLAAVAGIILGVMPLLLVWQTPRTGKEVPPPTRSHAIAQNAPRVSAPLQLTAIPQSKTRDIQLAPLLAEVSDLVDLKTRSVLQRQDIALTAISMGLGHSRNLKSQLAAVARDLEEVRTGLANIKANEAPSRAELLVVIGDTTSLEALITTLRNLRASVDSAADDNTLKEQAEELRSAVVPVQKWIEDCAQRVADLRKDAS